jgi:hypothetical protein
MVDAEDPEASGPDLRAGEGTGDIEGLEGEDVTDEGFELLFDGIASSTGVPRGDLVEIKGAVDEEESGEGIDGRFCAGRDKDDGMGLWVPLVEGLGGGDCPGLKSRTREPPGDKPPALRGLGCDEALLATDEDREGVPRVSDEWLIFRLLPMGDDGVLIPDLSTDAVGRKGDARAGTCRKVELDRLRGRGKAGAISIFAGTAGAVGGMIDDPLASALGSVSADLDSGGSSILPGDAGAVAGSEIGDGGTSTIATGIGEGVAITVSASGDCS